MADDDRHPLHGFRQPCRPFHGHDLVESQVHVVFIALKMKKDGGHRIG